MTCQQESAMIFSMQKIYVTESEINVLLQKIINDITNSQIEFTEVLGIARGGLHISKPLAKAFNLPHYSIGISFYDGEIKNDVPKVNLGDWQIKEKSNVLLCDDLIDSGSTIRYFKKNFNVSHKVAVYHRHTTCDIQPDYYGANKPDAWLSYFWESDFLQEIKIGEV